MTLEELLQVMNDAVAKSKANPEDKKLQQEAAQATKAYEDAKAEASSEEEEDEEETEEEEDDQESFNEDKADDKTKKYIQKLRKEAAANRVKAKADREKLKAVLKAAGIESEDEKPEELLKTTKARNEQLNFRQAVLEQALEHGIPKDSIDYFEFLIQKEVSVLEEGEELSDETMATIVSKVKKSGSKGSANSSVGGDGKPPSKGDKGEITLDKFCGLTVMEKCKLFESDPKLYESLAMQAKAKKRLV